MLSLDPLLFCFTPGHWSIKHSPSSFSNISFLCCPSTLCSQTFSASPYWKQNKHTAWPFLESAWYLWEKTSWVELVQLRILQMKKLKPSEGRVLLKVTVVVSLNVNQDYQTPKPWLPAPCYVSSLLMNELLITRINGPFQFLPSWPFYSIQHCWLPHPWFYFPFWHLWHYPFSVFCSSLYHLCLSLINLSFFLPSLLNVRFLWSIFLGPFLSPHFLLCWFIHSHSFHIMIITFIIIS